MKAGSIAGPAPGISTSSAALAHAMSTSAMPIWAASWDGRGAGRTKPKIDKGRRRPAVVTSAAITMRRTAPARCVCAESSVREAIVTGPAWLSKATPATTVTPVQKVAPAIATTRATSIPSSPAAA